MKFTPNELQVIRAALVLAVHGDDSAWDALSSEQEDIAQEIIDLIPDMGDEVNADEEDGEDEED